jgi:hypothetical protein
LTGSNPHYPGSQLVGFLSSRSIFVEGLFARIM